MFHDQVNFVIMSWVKEFLGFGRNVTKRPIDTDDQEQTEPAKKQKLNNSQIQIEGEESPATQFIKSIGSRMASWISPPVFPEIDLFKIESDTDEEERSVVCQADEDVLVDGDDEDVVELTKEPRNKESVHDVSDSDDEEEVVVIKVVNSNGTNRVVEEQVIKYDSPIKTFTGAAGTFTEQTQVTVSKTKKLTLVKTPENKENKTKAKNNNYRSVHDKFFKGECSSKREDGSKNLDLLRMRKSLKQVIKLDERDKYFKILTNYSGSNSPHITYQSSIQHQRQGMKQRKHKVTATQNPNTPIINLDPVVVTIDPPVITIEDVSGGRNVAGKSIHKSKSVSSHVRRNLDNSPDFLNELRKKYDGPKTRNILNSKLKENNNIEYLDPSDEDEIVDLDSDDDKEVIDLDASEEAEVVDLNESDSEDPEIEEVERLAKITKEMAESIERFCNTGDEILIDKYNIQIFRQDIDTLKGLNWLNDSVINFYMQMIVKRSKKTGYPKVYAANTFFYPKLMSSGHSRLKRWTKNIDIFSMDLILIPVHLGMHWCLAVVDFRKLGVYYYDSMGGNNQNCLEAILQYLKHEHREKKGTNLNVRRYSTKIVKNIPQQLNGSDCGVFSCKFAEFLSRDASISFSQKDMPHFRRRMIWEIAEDTLLHP